MRWLKDVAGVIFGALLVVGAFMRVTSVHRVGAARALGDDFPAFAYGIEAFHHSTGRLPGHLSDVVRSGLMRKLPIDPWRRAYLYKVGDGFVRITTLGADGLLGGTGADADLTCWVTERWIKSRG